VLNLAVHQATTGYWRSEHPTSHATQQTLLCVILKKFCCVQLYDFIVFGLTFCCCFIHTAPFTLNLILEIILDF
jgi:hypothetical protein